MNAAIWEVEHCEMVLANWRSSTEKRKSAKSILDKRIEASYSPQSTRFENMIADTIFTGLLLTCEERQNKQAEAIPAPLLAFAKTV